MLVGDYSRDDYDKVKDMWETQGSACPPIGVLGEKGLICWDGDIPLCAIFIFQPASEMGMIEFMVANIKADKKLRNKALDLILLKAIDLCQELGYKYIYTASSNIKFISRLEKKGFKRSGLPQQHMFWGL
ncbi:MAG TPA: hypothetical protein VMV86_01005 [Methanosarcinales archaeon]|nr:hypothetical protein [Methanosarcinales archaeon]